MFEAAFYMAMMENLFTKALLTFTMGEKTLDDCCLLKLTFDLIGQFAYVLNCNIVLCVCVASCKSD